MLTIQILKVGWKGFITNINELGDMLRKPLQDYKQNKNGKQKMVDILEEKLI